MTTVRILLADSSEISRVTLAQIIKNQPDMSLSGIARDGLDAVKLAGSLTPDIVILDVVLHNINGIEAARQILEHNPRIQIIVWTLHDDHRFFDAMTEAGAAGYVLKDSPFEELLTAIRTVMLGQSHIDARVKILKNHSTEKHFISEDD